MARSSKRAHRQGAENAKKRRQREKSNLEVFLLGVLGALAVSPLIF
jgi:hypothetical protein